MKNKKSPSKSNQVDKKSVEGCKYSLGGNHHWTYVAHNGNKMIYRCSICLLEKEVADPFL
jgi:hypothetical protein